MVERGRGVSASDRTEQNVLSGSRLHRTFCYLAQQLVLLYEGAGISVLDRRCGPLSDAVTERHDAAATLAELERSNLFLMPLDENRYWFRYHHLFADALRAHVRQTEPALVPRLYQRAAASCAAAELSDEAVSYALAGQASATPRARSSASPGQ